MTERALQVIATPQGSAFPAFLPLPVPKDPNEMYLCGYCGLNFDRNIPAFSLEASIIRCPNCGSLNRP